MLERAIPSTLSSSLHQAAQEDRCVFSSRRPDTTVLYQVIQQNWLTFLNGIEGKGKSLPFHVMREFEDYLQCGILANGFMRLKCTSCRHEKLIAFSCKRRGFCPSCAARRMSENAAFFIDHVLPHERIRQWVLSFPIPLRYWMAKNPALMTTVLSIVIRVLSTYHLSKAKCDGVQQGQTGAITLVQRFGGSINLNVHFHILMIEGVYEDKVDDAIFHKVSPPTDEEVRATLKMIQKRVNRALKKRGYLEEKEEGVIHAADLFDEDKTVEHLCQGASVQHRIALGDRAGQRVRRVGSFGEYGEIPVRDGPLCFLMGGFSLHANVMAEKRDELERLCRYIARPSVAESRLRRLDDGNIMYYFKKQWNDGTQAVLFSPTELIEKLVSLVPPPRIHLKRFHGVLAPHSRLRSRVVPHPPSSETEIKGRVEKSRYRLSWSELLKRVFQIDISICPDCGGQLAFIAAVLIPEVIDSILKPKNISSQRPVFKVARGPPQEIFIF